MSGKNLYCDVPQFSDWLIDNQGDWRFICGTSNRIPTDEEIWRLFHELSKLGKRSLEFNVVFLVFITRHFDRIFPDVEDDL